MSFKLEALSDLKRRIQEYPSIEIIYQRDSAHFLVIAGRTSWEGDFASQIDADDFETFLRHRQAYKVSGYVEMEQLFRVRKSEE